MLLINDPGLGHDICVMALSCSEAARRSLYVSLFYFLFGFGSASKLLSSVSFLCRSVVSILVFHMSVVRVISVMRSFYVRLSRFETGMVWIVKKRKKERKKEDKVRK